MKLAVLGPGALGCLLAALFHEAGADVSLVDYRPERVARLRLQVIQVHTLEGGHRVIKAPIGLIGYWAPVWIPLGLFAQIALLGLEPARAERDRLEREAATVEARHERTRTRFERMQAEREAWDDEVFRERWRRADQAKAGQESR